MLKFTRQITGMTVVLVSLALSGLLSRAATKEAATPKPQLETASLLAGRDIFYDADGLSFINRPPSTSSVMAGTPPSAKDGTGWVARPPGTVASVKLRAQPPEQGVADACTSFCSKPSATPASAHGGVLSRRNPRCRAVTRDACLFTTILAPRLRMGTNRPWSRTTFKSPSRPATS